jgi:hypothetical protein
MRLSAHWDIFLADFSKKCAFNIFLELQIVELSAKVSGLADSRRQVRRSDAAYAFPFRLKLNAPLLAVLAESPSGIF